MNNTDKPNKSILSDLSLVLTALMWGSGFIAMQIAIDSNMSPSLILSLRFSIASIILYFIFIKKLRNFTKKEIKHGLIAGFWMFSGFFVQTLGLVYTTPANNAFLTTMNVIFVPFIWWIMKKKAPKPKVFISAFISLIGIAILTYSAGDEIIYNIGDLLSLACALLFACHIYYIGTTVNNASHQKFTFIQMVFAAILSLVALFVFDFKAIGAADYGSGIVPIIYPGVFSTCLAFLLQIIAQKKTPSTKAAIIMSLEAVFGSIFSVLFGYDILNFSLIIGGFIVMTAVVFMEVSLPKISLRKKSH